MVKLRTINRYILLLMTLIMLSCSTDPADEYSINASVEPAEAGIISKGSINAAKGEIVELTAIPNEHWVFVEWQGDVIKVDDRVVFILLDRDITATAHFVKREYPLTLNVEGNGTVTEEVIQAKTVEYAHATVLKITAAPDRGWELIGWSGNAAGKKLEIENVLEFEFEIEGPSEITAHFDRINYTVDVSVEGSGRVEREFTLPKVIEDLFPFETEVTLRAIPSTGWEFVEWTGDETGKDEVIRFVVEENMSIEAVFARIDYTLTVNVNGEGTFRQTVLPASSAEFPFETVVQIEAIPGTDWSFGNWKGTIDSFDRTISIVMDRDKTVELNFYPIPQNARLLQLGDSITNGLPYAYRFDLFNLLKNIGITLNYVGTQSSNPGGFPGVWNTVHEGHNGATIAIINQELSGWIQGYTADIVLIHIGTNDVINLARSGSPATGLIQPLNDLTSVINKLRGKNPNVRFYVAQIIPIEIEPIHNLAVANLIQEWNLNLFSMANNLTTDQSPIKIVNMNAGISTTMLTDGIHPSRDVVRVMANRWFEALLQQ